MNRLLLVVLLAGCTRAEVSVIECRKDGQIMSIFYERQGEQKPAVIRGDGYIVWQRGPMAGVPVVVDYCREISRTTEAP